MFVYYILKCSNLAMEKVEGTKCTLYYNNVFAVLSINATNLTLVGGNTTGNIIAKLPANVKVHITSKSTSVMDASWRPTANNARITCSGAEWGEDITLRSSVSANTAVIYEEIFLSQNYFEVK